MLAKAGGIVSLCLPLHTILAAAYRVIAAFQRCFVHVCGCCGLSLPLSPFCAGAELETSQRFYGCDLITRAGILLRLPPVVYCTAQVLFHRFYCKKSMLKYNVRVSR